MNMYRVISRIDWDETNSKFVDADLAATDILDAIRQTTEDIQEMFQEDELSKVQSVEIKLLGPIEKFQ